MKTSIISALALALVLCGCSTSKLLTSTEPQQTIYTLRPIASTGLASAASAQIVEISMPSLPPGMDRDRIALFLDDGQKLDYYASARWSSSLDHILQDVTRRSISAVLPYVVAVTPEQDIEAEYRLQIKVNELQPVYGTDSKAAPVLKASLEFTLIRQATNQVVSSFTLSKQSAPTENRLDMIILGLEQLLQEIERKSFTKLGPKLRAPQ